MKMKLKTLLILLFILSSISLADQYPKIDVSGFKKWQYRDAKVHPQSNYFLGLTHLGGFSPTSTGSPWQELLQLSIMGQLTEKLTVSYDVEQQPDSPDKYDVKVNYDNKHQLTFGDFSANFSGNEFASSTKFLNGVMVTSKDNNYDFLAVPSAKLKSQVQNLTSQKGNNSKGPYSLGHGSIIEGSEHIELNGVTLQKGKDYLIDYFEGKVTFTRILSSADEFKYNFEFTNLLDLFFPALSKKDFFGIQGRMTLDPSTIGQKTPIPEPKLTNYEQTFPTVLQPQAAPQSPNISAQYSTILEIKKSSVEAYAKSVYKKMQDALANRKYTKATELKNIYNAAVQRLENIIKLIKESPKPAIVNSSTVEAKNTSTSTDAIGKVKINEDVIADELTGKYKLQYIPVVPFSENIVFKGTVLKKNEDYAIKYEDGSLALLIPVIPTSDDPLHISYKYFTTETRTDIIPGNGGRGPYAIVSANIIPKSEKIVLDGRQLVRDYDYLIDYSAGKFTFNYNISNTSQIKASYDSQVMELPPVPPPPKYPKSITLGMTYLKESSKKGASSATSDIIETKVGADIIKNNNTAYLSKFPVLSSSEGGTIVVKINGVVATPEVDYSFPSTAIDPTTGYAVTSPEANLAFINDRYDTSNGYQTGSIKILASIEATTEVTAIYTYKKSVVGRFTGVGTGGRGPYYIKNFRNIVPGSERVEVWSTGSPVTDTYIRNSSFEANAGDQGYSISYVQDLPYLTFNKELQSTQNFSIYFQYIAPQGNEGGDLSQDVLGLDAAMKFGEILQFDGNFAKSTTDQIITAVGTTDSFSNFILPTSKVTLPNKPIIENSEKVYVNNYLRNKDIDYFIDYTSGSLSFFYITLSTQDVVSVDYQYQSSQGVSQGEQLKTDQAFKYGVKSTLGKISMAYNSKQIGFDFNPLGGTAIGVGSNYRDFSVALAPTVQDFQTSYTYRETNNPIGTTRLYFSRNYDRTYTAGINPFGIAKIDFGFRNSAVKGDPIDVGGNATADNSMNSYSIGISPLTLNRGVISFSQRYDAQRSLSEDKLGFTKGKIESGHINYSLGLTDRVKLSSDFQISEPLNLRTLTGEVETSHSLSRDIGYDASVDLTFARIKRLTTYAKLLNHESINLVPSPESKTATRNTTYHVDFAPIDMISTNYDYNRQETPSVVVDGKNPKSERTVTNVNLTPHPALSSGWSHSEDQTINESARSSSGNSDTYNTSWTPISYEKIKLSSTYTIFGRSSISPSGTSDATAVTRSFVQDYNLTLSPVSIVNIVPGFAQEEYSNSTSISTSELRTRNQTVRCKVNFKPFNQLSMDADYNLKVTTSVTDNINRHKTLASLRTGYKMFSWGEIVHSLEEEHNEGEVQAGGVLPSLDYLKTTNTFNLNFSIPQENPILNSVLLTASYKLVKFENRLRPSDNLFGYLMSFEGTLNF